MFVGDCVFYLILLVLPVYERRVCVAGPDGSPLFNCIIPPMVPVVDWRNSSVNNIHHYLSIGSSNSDRNTFLLKTNHTLLKVNAGRAVPWGEARKIVANLIYGKVVVGYQLWFEFAGAYLFSDLCVSYLLVMFSSCNCPSLRSMPGSCYVFSRSCHCQWNHV